MEDKIMFEKDNRKLKNPKHFGLEKKNVFIHQEILLLSQQVTKRLMQK